MRYLCCLAPLAIALAMLADPAFSRDSGGNAGNWGVNLSDQDKSVQPGDDFAMFQNGHWYASTQLGPQQPNAAYWRDVRLKAAGDLSKALAELATEQHSKPTHAETLLAAFYRSATDSENIEAQGLRPLAPELAAIRSAADHTALARLSGDIEGPGTLRNPTVRTNAGRGIFSLSIAQDQRDPSKNAVYIGQGGMILPGPEYYVDDKLSGIRTSYETYIAQVLKLIGWDEPGKRATQIVEFETRVARVSWPHERMRDAAATYNPMSIRQLEALAPAYPWREFFAGAGLPQRFALVIDAPPAFRDIAKIYSDTPLEVLEARQAFAAAHTSAKRLTSALNDAYDAFGKLVQQGLQKPFDRAYEAEKWSESCLPDALSALYVSRYSSPQVKVKAESIATNIKRAMDRRLAKTPWISAAGREKARAKLKAMKLKIGYPDKFDDYAKLDIDESDFYGNVSRASAYLWHKKVASLGKTIDRGAWMLTPFYPQYNYNLSTNSVEIPAALLVAPFFDLAADDAVNYGADGTVIGAMMMAGFDTTGVNYDAQGRLHPWLSAADTTQLQAAINRVAERYSREEPLPGLHIKGNLVADEAFDDIGGIQIALDAYRASVNGRSPVLDGYSGEQRFFLARAQMWRAKFSVEFTRNQIATGSNAPPYLRVNGPLPNIDAWYDAFHVTRGNKLFVPQEDRIASW